MTLNIADDITSNTGNRSVANFKSPRIWHVVFADTFTCDNRDITELNMDSLNFLHYNMELLNPDALGNPREHFSDEETGKNRVRYTLQPLYNTLHYNMGLDITRFKDGPKNV